MLYYHYKIVLFKADVEVIGEIDELHEYSRIWNLNVTERDDNIPRRGMRDVLDSLF